MLEQIKEYYKNNSKTVKIVAGVVIGLVILLIAC